MSKRVRKNTLRRKSVKRRRNTKRRRRMMSGGGGGTIQNADPAHATVKGWLTSGGLYDHMIPNGAFVNILGKDGVDDAGVIRADLAGLTKVRWVPPPLKLYVGTRHINHIQGPGAVVGHGGV